MKAKLLFVLCLTFFAARAQTNNQLYMPLEFQKAYMNGTRKLDGTISSKYWQNRSVYNLRAEIDPATRTLRGKATITYFNNSPDTVRNPTFHTYHDYYKRGSERSGFFASGDEQIENEGMVIERLVVNGQAYDPANREEVLDGGTFRVIRLKKPLLPKGKITLEIDWRLTIAGEGFERSGAIDSTSMFVGYWYPEMAVMDDINGWDRVVYNAATEFYHDYSDYTVEITIPDNFTVWASVAPQNEREVYSPEVLSRLSQAKKSETPVKILTPADINKKPSGKKTWRYEAKNFPDFAFALSDHYLWDAAHYSDKHGGYFFQATFPVDHPEFASVVESISKSLKLFHTEYPVYPFPYKYFTIFNGLQGGGMEFPGMANNDNTTAQQILEWTGMQLTDQEANMGLTLHEMFHMYFPFLMGINEKHYAWMDEGLATFSEFFLPSWPAYQADQEYLGNQSVLPMMAPSYSYKNSSLNSYTIAAQSYNALYELLGKDSFDKAMQAYITEWKYKHPTPYDFMFTFNRVSGADLNWFWKKWYFDWGYLDLGISSFANNVVTVENIGGRPLPFTLTIQFQDGTETVKEFTPGIWKSTSTFTWKVPDSKKKVKSIALEVPGSGDALHSNNTWK